jgi:hypothetical protein
MQKYLQDPISTNKKAGCGGVHLSFQLCRKLQRIMIQIRLGINITVKKITKVKRAGVVTQVVES